MKQVFIILFLFLVGVMIVSAQGVYRFPYESENPYYDVWTNFTGVSLQNGTGNLNKGLNASFEDLNVTGTLITQTINATDINSSGEIRVKGALVCSAGDERTALINNTDANFTSVNVVGNITALGNISANFIHADGRFLTNLNLSLDDAYNSGASGQHLVTIDNGPLIFVGNINVSQRLFVGNITLVHPNSSGYDDFRISVVDNKWIIDAEVADSDTNTLILQTGLEQHIIMGLGARGGSLDSMDLGAFGNVYARGIWTFNSTSRTVNPLTIAASPGQQLGDIANITEWRNVTGKLVASIDRDGNFFNLGEVPGITFDKVYNSQSGAHKITVDDGGIFWKQEANNIGFNLTSIGGGASRFEIGLVGGVTLPSSFNIYNSTGFNTQGTIFKIGETSVHRAGAPSIESVGWVPLDDNLYDLGTAPFIGAPNGLRWRDLFLAGTIKGQNGSVTTLEFNAVTGSIDTTGNLNVENITATNINITNDAIVGKDFTVEKNTTLKGNVSIGDPLQNQSALFGFNGSVFLQEYYNPNVHFNYTGTLSMIGNVNIDTNTFFVDSSNNRVSIGTISPKFKLDVDGKINATAYITNEASGKIITCTVGEIRGNATANKICLCTTANNWKCATVS